MEKPKPRELGDPPEVVKHTPFPVALLYTTDEDNAYFTAVTKVSLELTPDGRTIASQEQEELFGRSMADGLCPERPIVVDDTESFRPLANLYLRPSAQPSAQLSIELAGSRVPLGGTSLCPHLSTMSTPLQVPFIRDGTTIKISDPDSGPPRTLEVPDGFTPFVLVRYANGAKVPAPMRLDTLTIDPIAARVVAVYRSTFAATTPIKKVEFRALQPDDDVRGSESESRENALARANATRDFLNSCPVPDEPGEECVRDDAKVPSSVFSRPASPSFAPASSGAPAEVQASPASITPAAPIAEESAAEGPPAVAAQDPLEPAPVVPTRPETLPKPPRAPQESFILR